jgi:uncharacterized protein (DUF362 family)
MRERRTELECDAYHRRADSVPGISRRLFLKGMGAAAAGLLAAACRPPSPAEPPGPTPGTLPAKAATPARSQVAIAQARSYDRNLVHQQVQALLDGLGGLDDVISSGDRVAIKVNLTGGTHFTSPFGVTATESYLTHPQIVRALVELLRDAGARELFIVEGVYDEESYHLFGYEEVAKALDATLIDLNNPYPYSGFTSTPVGEGAFIYDAFSFNPILEEIDAFVSVAKMKCHFECGVTHSMKNLIGLVPVREYHLDETHWWRSALHGREDQTKARLPRVILDLNRARPIHLAVIDGIKTAEGGEVPRGTFKPVEPGLLLAGKNPVATDAVATAAMGFDPTVEPPAPPFLRGDNYLNLAYELALGTNRLEEIEVVGASIDEVVYQFEPSWEM